MGTHSELSWLMGDSGVPTLSLDTQKEAARRLVSKWNMLPDRDSCGSAGEVGTASDLAPVTACVCDRGQGSARTGVRPFVMRAPDAYFAELVNRCTSMP